MGIKKEKLSFHLLIYIFVSLIFRLPDIEHKKMQEKLFSTAPILHEINMAAREICVQTSQEKAFGHLTS